MVTRRYITTNGRPGRWRWLQNFRLGDGSRYDNHSQEQTMRPRPTTRRVRSSLEMSGILIVCCLVTDGVRGRLGNGAAWAGAIAGAVAAFLLCYALWPLARRHAKAPSSFFDKPGAGRNS